MHRHFVLHKPSGVLSQFINNKTRKKKLLGDLFDFPEGTMAIGRLDAQSEGLLFLTTDGKVSAQVGGRKFEKEYWVQVDGVIDEPALEKLRNGVAIRAEGVDFVTLPCPARKFEEAPKVAAGRRIREERHGPTSWISITLREGKNRQVRRMTAAVGFPTLRLIRYRIGSCKLDDLAPAEVREVLTFEPNLEKQ